MLYDGASNGGNGSVTGGDGDGDGDCSQNEMRRTVQGRTDDGDAGHMFPRVVHQNPGQRLPNKPANDGLRQKPPQRIVPNHILLFTIFNPSYPITVDVLHKICDPHGRVLRVVIFKKNGVQAMVEFDSLDAATRVRQNLNGADIYSGCCTLKIEFAKQDKLNVYKNEPDSSWDYTVTTSKLPLIARNSIIQKAMRQNHESARLGGPGADLPSFGMPEFHLTIHPTGPIEPTVTAGRNSQVVFASQGQGLGLGQGQGQGTVMMIYGLDHETSNTDKLFNLVCLYGNVARIKILKTKEGTAMIQMGDSIAVERCVQHFNNIPIGENHGKLQIAFSKQNFLSEVIIPYLLPDNTLSFKEYTGSKNNRFLSPAQTYRNRVQPPSKILHFFNTPPRLTEDQLSGIFNMQEVPPISVCLFPLKTERSSSGLIEFPNIAQAVLAIMKCNHLPIDGKGSKYPFIMKLCFSSSKTMYGDWNNEANEGMIEKENEGETKINE